MTKKNYSYIALVCDRSGSMNMVRTDAEGAVNKFIEDQKAVPGEATLHLVDFDAPNSYGSGENNWYNLVFKGDIQEAPKYALQPRGNTALLDATGMTIVAVGEQLAAMSEDERPEHVVFVVQTDGQENSSKDWVLDKLREKITEQESKWNWQFVFLGMGPDTYAQGHAMGISNVTRAKGTGASYAASYQNTSDVVGAFRTGNVSNLAGANVAVDDEGNVTSED
jgi:hypothetical protein